MSVSLEDVQVGDRATVKTKDRFNGLTGKVTGIDGEEIEIKFVGEKEAYWFDLPEITEVTRD